MIFLFLFLSHALAADPRCDTDVWALKGAVYPYVQRYDKMLAGLARSKDPIAEVNRFLAAHGLPLTASVIDDPPKAFPDRLEADGISGVDAAVFLKKIDLPVQSGLTLDEVVEIDAAGKRLRTWNAEYNGNGPAAVVGDELIYRKTLTSICGGGVSYLIEIAVKPNGAYRALKPRASYPKSADAPSCDVKKVFPDSDYAACKDFPDGKKSHRLVFEMPMT